MKHYLSCKEVSRLWDCTERSVQLLCKQGKIPGAEKVSGVWLLPADSVRPAQSAEQTSFCPEALYGRGTAVRVDAHPLQVSEKSGCIITRFQVVPGITLVFQEIYEEHLDYGSAPPPLPEDLIAIQHCREGRFEGEYPNGECVYMGPGSLSVNLPSWSPVSNSFPLHHYRGFYIAVLPQIAENSVQQLEAILGPLHIDFQDLEKRLSFKNRLVLYSANAKTAALLDSLYADFETQHQQRLGLSVLRLLQLLTAEEMLPRQTEQYFTREQVRTVKQIRQYVTAHLDRHIPQQALAARFGLSLTAMKTCFKGVYGQSIEKYLRAYRMQAGAEQLASTDLRVIEIAAAVGYENAGKFSKAFAGCYGMTPTEYRKTFCPCGPLRDSTE